MPALTLVWGQGHGSNTIEGPETRFAKGIDDYKGKGISWFSVWVWSETTDFVNFVTVWQNQRQIGLILAFQSSPSSGDGPQLGFCSTFPKFPNLKWPSSAIKLASFPMFSPFLWFRPLDTQHRAIARYVATYACLRGNRQSLPWLARRAQVGAAAPSADPSVHPADAASRRGSLSTAHERPMVGCRTIIILN